MTDQPRKELRLGIVVVNFASSDLLEANLVPVVKDLRGSGTASINGLTVVVVDNFTSHEELDAVRQLGLDHGFEILASTTNVGFGAGVNRGVTHAVRRGAEAILVLNPDAWIEAGSIEKLVRHVVLHPEDLAAPTVYRPDESVWSSGMDVDLAVGQLRATRRRPRDVPADRVLKWVSGACFVVSTQLWLAIAGFDEEYFMYWEDVDLCRRIEALGGRSIVVHGARAFHDESGTQRHKGHRSPLFYYYNTRNRLLFASKHLSADQQKGWKRASRANIGRMVRPEGLSALRPPWTSVRSLIRGERDGRRYLRDRGGQR